MSDSSALPFDTLLALAPQDLVSHRTERYAGDGMAVSLAHFEPADQSVIQHLYVMLNELLQLTQAYVAAPNVRFIEQVRTFVAQTSWSALLRQLKELGNNPAYKREDKQLHQSVHDIRGGALQALALQLQMLELMPKYKLDGVRMFFLTRDHMKIMRNAIRDIDPERVERDHSAHEHHVNLLVEKWQHALHAANGHTALVHVDSYFDGNVSERCLEFSALDRVLYNLLNNAVQYTANEQIYFAILPVPGDEARNLRFAVYNPVSPEQHARLNERYGDRLGDLFQGGFTTGGSGLGLRICGDFVTNAYGGRAIDRTIEQGYVGATLIREYFVSWVHWPIATN